MTWVQREAAFRKLQRDADILAAEQADRERHPELWLSAGPPIGHRGDLWEGDARRDEGR
jgi:hypothetical protein